MKIVRKLLPLSLYDISGLEAWMDEQGRQGLFPTQVRSWVTFQTCEMTHLRFRLAILKPRQKEPTPEEQELYQAAGWRYTFSIGEMYALYYTNDPQAPEPFTDLESRGDALAVLKRRLNRHLVIQSIGAALLVAVLVWAIWIYRSPFDVQPGPHYSSMPLLVLSIFQPIPLIYLLLLVSFIVVTVRHTRRLRRICRRLKDGLPPPPSPGPSRAIRWQNGLTLALIPIMILFTLWNQYGPEPQPSTPTQPYPELASIETVPLTYTAGQLNDFSLLAPLWYTVEQRGEDLQTELGNIFSPDPNSDENYRYAPRMESIRLRVLIPGTGKWFAQGLVERMRLVNLYWTYEELTYTGLDWVMYADSGDGIYQMAALVKGRDVLVCRYGGGEDLSQHLDLLHTFL